MSRHPAPPDAPIGYVLKGYPRISELFIASEIYRLEQLGLPLQIYVLKPADERTRHPVVDRISAPVAYGPATDSLSRSGLPSWLYRNGGAFVAPMLRMALRRPLRMLRTVTDAARQSWRARRGARPRKIYVKEFLQACWLADSILRGGGVRRLHAHFAHGTTTVTWLAATLLDVPFSFTGHAKDLYLESLNPAGLLARKMKAATAVVTCTGANVDHLRSLVPEVPVHLAYHGLNAEFSALIAQAPPATEPRRARLMSVGRLVRKKGFDVLIEAVALLRDRGVDLELVIAGEEGSEANAVRRLVSSLGLDTSVTFLGPLSQARLLGEYRRSTLFALACRVGDDGDRDGIPNVLVEAMAAGLPVVSTTISGIPELVTDEETGLLVPPEDAHALADAIGRLVTDAALRQRLATAAEKRVAEDFDGSVLAGRLAELLVAR